MTSRHYLPQHDRSVALWLIACAVVIFGMILLGGVTRLTGSGLSMVEWRPLMGIIPPLSEAEWQAVFDKYRQFPEYQQINRGMSLDGFKVIFMYEYLHRVLGRLIGVLFFVPLLVFALRGMIRPGMLPRLLLLFVLGGCQGLLGWYMVQSGLVDRPSVSQYRLAAHLGLAVAIYGFMLWVILDLWRHPQRPAPSNDYRSGLGVGAVALVALVYLMILSGALVAGTDAGFAYSTWPKMGPTFVPEGLYAMEPAWLAAFEDVTTIQFNHRLFAYLLAALLVGFAVVVLQRETQPRIRWAALGVVAALTLQLVLGISTLLLHVPVPLAAAHQGGAVLLLSSTIFLAHTLLRRASAHA
ncbi:COX15/CtaA family protein [Chromatocurvus halotolerans]|uniref:Cytochrome c oxidase assembly protein subunit 15 n=1 Tax=Chromatocurvus halotolerans TaxID=1132028 RepID=A0A4R2KRP8_9GAMM|nr:COX15/CtaA family protein [Chromatocurvus halotolerans]TCO75437.1 cytochrome c oxidase assembly protein subunit 15 [Chromatocurvus halotolerans]